MSEELNPATRRWLLVALLTGVALVFGGWVAEEGLQQVGLRAPDEALGVTTRSGVVYIRTDWAISIHALGTLGAILIFASLWIAGSKINRDAQVRSERAIAKSLNKSVTDVGVMMDFGLLGTGVLSAVQIGRLSIDLLNVLT
jgi:hypothetical protein